VEASFGCLPAQAERFRRITESSLLRCEEHNVLAEVRSQGPWRQPKVPTGGFSRVLDAVFALPERRNGLRKSAGK
jgi:hypothetical protein